MICSTLICVVVMCLGRRSKAMRRASKNQIKLFKISMMNTLFNFFKYVGQPATTAFIITPNSYLGHSALNNNIIYENSTSDNNLPPPPPYATLATSTNDNLNATVNTDGNQVNQETNDRKSLEPPKYEVVT